MKVLGSGLMGPAAAFNAVCDPDVSQVVVCDLSQRQLDACLSKLAGMRGIEKLSMVLLDLNDQAAASRLMADFDAAIGALPRSASVLAIRAATRANTPLVDLTRPDHNQLPGLRQEVEAAGGLVVLGCGVEAVGEREGRLRRYRIEMVDRYDEELGFTSMARTTAFTGAIVARMHDRARRPEGQRYTAAGAGHHRPSV